MQHCERVMQEITFLTMVIKLQKWSKIFFRDISYRVVEEVENFFPRNFNLNNSNLLETEGILKFPTEMLEFLHLIRRGTLKP